MKQKLLICAAAAMTAVAATGAPTSVSHKKALKNEPVRKAMAANKRNIRKTPSLMQAAPLTRAEKTSIDWGYCEDPFNAIQLDSYTVNQAIYVSEEQVNEFAGNQVNAVLVGTPANIELFDEENWEYGNDIESVKVWLKYSLNDEPFAEATGKFNDIAFTWTTVDLDKPYIIEAGKPFIVGITYELNVIEDEEGEYSNDYGYVTDYGYPETSSTNLVFTNFTGIDDEGEYIFSGQPSWRDLGDYFGNASIRLNISGDHLPQNRATITDTYLPTFTKAGEEIQISMTVRNLGANTLENVDVCLAYDNGTTQTVNVPVTAYDYDWNLVPSPIDYNQYGILAANFKGPDQDGYVNYTITIPTLNGGQPNEADFSKEGMLLALSEGYHKNNIVEEATGTWCGYCPTGYVGMKWLAENYEEEAIGIALHYDDPMDVLKSGAYSSFKDYVSGYPSSFINRNWVYDVFPAPEYLEEEMEAIKDIPALGQIKATLVPASDDGRTVKLNADIEFSIPNESGLFAVAYAVVEDGVGPYSQTNYFSDEDPGTGYGFEDMPYHVDLIYDDVARNCSHPTPIKNSLPATVAVGATYNFSTEIVLSDVANLNNYRVVPMIINTKTGYIENACVVKSPTYDYSAVKDLRAEQSDRLSVAGGKGVITLSGNSDNVRIFTIDGRYIGKADGVRTAVAPGLYIVTRGIDSAKVIVR